MYYFTDMYYVLYTLHTEYQNFMDNVRSLQMQGIEPRFLGRPA
jgi:hypothetical protein